MNAWCARKRRSFKRRSMRGVLAVLVAVLVAVVAVGHGAEPVGAKSARYSAFDVDMTVLDDGTFRVVETQTVRFEGGPFQNGHREVYTARTDGIANIRVSELIDGKPAPFTETDLSGMVEGPNRFSVMRVSGSAQIRWTFAPATDETRTFIVQYDMLQALRSYPDEATPNQQVWWTPVGGALTDETPVDGTTVRVTLPAAVDLSTVEDQNPSNNAVLLGENADEPVLDHTTDGQRYTWEHGPFDGGDELTLRMQFPILLPDYGPPGWQAADDAQRAREQTSESRNAFIHLMMLAVGLLAVGGGGTGLYGAWYLRGRDPHVGLVADFLPQPPDDLSPGAAGALVDEVAHECDVIATLLDLVRRGVVTMRDAGLEGPVPKATGRDYVFELRDPKGPFAPHERRMLDAMYGRHAEIGATTRLSRFGPSVRAKYEAYKQDLYKELVDHGYFTRSPESTRDNWARTGLVVIVLGVLGGVIGWLAFDAWALIPAIAVIAVGFAVRRLSRAMPRKTEQGAQAAAKWRAFKRYLTDIRRYEKLQESRRIFEEYLPYAIAFGLEQRWVTAFARASAEQAPAWRGGDVFIPDFGGSWGNGRHHRHGGTVIIGNGGGGGRPDLPDVDLPNMPDLQKMSNRASSGVQAGSSGLMEVLKVAGAILEIASAFSGGGSSGGSSGGGGGGFD